MMETGVLLDRADILLNQGRYKDAEDSIKQVLQQEPDNDYALAMLGRCYVNTKRYDEGLDVIQQAIALSPNNDFYFYLLGFTYYQKDIYKVAKEQLGQAIEINPYRAEYYGMMSHVLLQEKEFERALFKANEGLAIDPENLTCLNARSIALNKLKRTEDAIATMQNALAQDPDNSITHATVGWNFLEKGRHKDAQKHFLEALRIEPNYGNAKTGLKESLKSKVPPYRWLLQYSFWVHNSGKKVAQYLPIILYIVFRVLIAAFKSNDSTSGIAWALGGLYLLFVVTSWSINSIANFFLLFHPLGKHALTNSERWSAKTVVVAMISGLLLLVASEWIVVGSEGGQYFIAGLILISLALPLGVMEYPIQVKSKSKRELFTKLLLITGLISLLVVAVAPEAGFVLSVIYLLGFMIYNWTGIGK
jgi:tetratricopeptide (TPR) repeat protein